MVAIRSHGGQGSDSLASPRVVVRCSHGDDPTSARQVQKCALRHRGPRYDPAMTGPLPDEALDALVLVLDEIRLGRSRSRSELVERTGLGRAIVAQRVGELIERGLVRRGRPRAVDRRAPAAPAHVPGRRRPPPRRRPRRHERRRRDHRRSTAGSSAITTSRPRSRPVRRWASAGSSSCSTSCSRRRRPFPAGCGGSGSRVPGPVEFATGRPISPPIMPGWDGYPIRERFAARYGAPVWVDNDVNVLALGEWRSGVAAGHDDVVVVKIGTGIGAGIISGGRLHRGAQGSAGDVGHIQVTDDPAVDLPLRERRAAWRRSPAAARSAQAGEVAARTGRIRAAPDGPRPARDGDAPRTSHGRRRPATRSRSRCSRPPAGGSARCSRASSTSSTRRWS